MKWIQRALRRALARLDAAFDTLYTWRFNPLYHSGALVVGCFVVLLVTGLYLLLFYRVGAPHASVERISGQLFAGRWIRTLHRYVSDLAILAAGLHALRMLAQGRAWGPRTLAWVSGLILLFVFFVCGWTGYVMVWDTQAHVLADEGARFFDLLPIFSEPISRAFAGEHAMPGAFFFLNLFAHIALPVGIALILWIHVSRLARSSLMPPRGLFWGVVALFTALSMIWPVAVAPEANLLRLPGAAHFDVIYGFWLPIAQALGPGWSGSAALVFGALLLAVPFLVRPPAEKRPAPSVVNERLCTGCEQCYHDCPYEAISMVGREDGRSGYVAWVDPTKCVSCGICAGSCAPMGVGPPLRTGRDQLTTVRDFLDEVRPGPSDVVIVACQRGAGGAAAEKRFRGAPVFGISCAGSLHTSVVEYLVRGGAGGVLVVSCPPRNCWNREGVAWLEARVNDGREAELKERVDRRRVRLAYAGEGEGRRVAAELEAFREEVAALEAGTAEEDIDLTALCEPPEMSVAEEAVR